MAGDTWAQVIRSRFVLRWSGRFACLLLAGCVVYLLYDRWTILPTTGRLRLHAFMLNGAWWGGQLYYWTVLIGAGTWTLWRVVRGLARLRGSAQGSPCRSRVIASLANAWKVSLITLVLLELASGAVLWLEARPAALPERLGVGAGEIRIAVMGDSTAAGYPYGTPFSFSAMVGNRLEDLFPSCDFEVENVGKPGATFEQAYGMLSVLQAKPDVLFVYGGHNEVLMRYTVDRLARERRWPRWSLLVRLIEQRHELVQTRQYASQYGTVDNFKLGQRARPLFDRPALTDGERGAVYANLRRHVEALVRWCLRQEILPVLIIPAANESGFEPCRSCLPFGLSSSKEERLRAIYAELHGGGAVGSERRAQLLDDASRLCPSFAMTWFLRGRSYESSGQIDQARRAYGLALDRDGFPWHATAEVATIYTEIARAWDCPLLDAREILRPLSGNGILDEAVFHDAVHPTFAGHAAIADAVLAKLREVGVVTPSHQWPQLRPSDVALLAEELELSDEIWIRVCQQASLSHGSVPRWHWEHERRLGWSGRYAEAGRAIRDGMLPEETGAPGIGTRMMQGR